ncbi:restriction endonuclease subunit S [Bifidobacterium breve]|uniref:restriction endonuclease subunit S n=2 Tax=Bifidobacterium breve TaxID=1685 RepID=UPI001177ED95|nr:restriction endonuclease subunit S [Bifidobacterium breve]MBK5036678.1 restriction endonuclease subunit S [Bifidobacterium breve]MBK5055614.1 restriction endonuclease subunit S [Bifidobacterium breve]
MLKKRGGICPSAYLPVEGRVTRFQQNDILLSNIRPYFKKIWLSDRIGGCCADVLVFRAKHREHTEWLYQTMAADRFFSYVSIGAKGSKMPRGDKEHMMRYPVAMPPKELLCVFSKLYSPMHNQIAKLYKENIHLANLRDWLLPLLMNGQATIDK